MVNLEHLIIHRNAIEELGSDLFKFTPKIIDVYFRNNGISRVGKDLFAKINSFERIDFSDNKCVNRGTRSNFKAAIDVVVAKCPHHKDTYCLDDFDRYESEIASLKAENVQKEIETAKEISALKAEIERLNRIWFNELLNPFTSFVRKLSVTFSGLFDGDTRTFFGIENFASMNLSGNELLEITEDYFIELTNLKELDLSHNNIELIHENAFVANIELEALKLDHNQLTAISSLC